MEEKKGIEEAKELIKGVNKLIIILVREFKDGFQIEDLVSIFTQLATDRDLREAINGMDQLGGEFKDLDWSEGIELGQILLGLVPEIMKELKDSD
ncbi:MAG TPA: hypothetical protein DCS66_04915 [Flavobacteriaceae bacterium]|nr:hypothetical protein [Flavobacteriaceae bacterium]